MDTLKYSRNKLTMRLAGAGAMLVGALYLFLNQDLADQIPFPFDMFGGDDGHYIALPITVVTSGILAWLAASRLISGGNAVECLADEIRVTNFWGRKRIRWDDLGHIYLEKKRRRFVVRHKLVFHHVGGGLFGGTRVKLPLDLTELPPREYEKYRESLLAKKHGTAARPVASSGNDSEESDSTFDPDAVIARYLARKNQAQPEAPRPSAPAPAPAPAPAARPAFGRKGL